MLALHHKIPHHESLWSTIPAGFRELLIAIAAGLIITIIVSVSVRARKRAERKKWTTPLFVKKQSSWNVKRKKKR